MTDTPQEIVSDSPGYKTTEFWKSLIVSALTLLTGLGAIGPNVPAKYQAIIDSAALLAAAGSTGFYALSRGKTKAAALTATANVINNNKQIALQRQINQLPTPTVPAVTSARKQTSAKA